jgi:hypothetical protein
MSQEQQEALYGPLGKADHQQGDTIRFSSLDTGGEILTGEILYVRAPAPAIQGGKVHPTAYITYVEDELFPRVVYPSDVVAELTPNRP